MTDNTMETAKDVVSSFFLNFSLDCENNKSSTKEVKFHLQLGLTCRKAEIRRVEVVIAAHHCLFLFVSATQLCLKILFPYCSALCVFRSFKDTNRYRNRVIIVSPRYYEQTQIAV